MSLSSSRSDNTIKGIRTFWLFLTLMFKLHTLEIKCNCGGYYTYQYRWFRDNTTAADFIGGHLAEQHHIRVYVDGVATYMESN